MRPQLRPDIQAAVQPLIDEARAEGYAAGLEAAAKWHESRIDKTPTRPVGNRSTQHWKAAKAIRALKEKPKP